MTETQLSRFGSPIKERDHRYVLIPKQVHPYYKRIRNAWTLQRIYIDTASLNIRTDPHACTSLSYTNNSGQMFSRYQENFLHFSLSFIAKRALRSPASVFCKNQIIIQKKQSRWGGYCVVSYGLTEVKMFLLIVSDSDRVHSNI